jgi:hypothetical protein
MLYLAVLESSVRLPATIRAQAIQLQQMTADRVARPGLNPFDQSSKVIHPGELDCLTAATADHRVVVARGGRQVAVAAILAMDPAYQIQPGQHVQRTVYRDQSQVLVR